MLGDYLVEKANQRIAIDPEFREAIEKISLLEMANEGTDQLVCLAYVHRGRE
jgi:hypothetical protein